MKCSDFDLSAHGTEKLSHIRHFRTEKKTGTSLLSQRLLGLFVETENNWPITDRRVLSNNPRSLCETPRRPAAFSFLKW